MSGLVPLTLSRVAASIGELEPLRDSDDMTADHFRRWDQLERLALSLPVAGPADAALALSLAASAIGVVRECDLTEAERDERLRRVLRMLAGVAGWLDRDMGAPPQKSPWPDWASPEVGA